MIHAWQVMGFSEKLHRDVKLNVLFSCLTHIVHARDLSFGARERQKHAHMMRRALPPGVINPLCSPQSFQYQSHVDSLAQFLIQQVFAIIRHGDDKQHYIYQLTSQNYNTYTGRSSGLRKTQKAMGAFVIVLLNIWEPFGHTS